MNFSEWWNGETRYITEGGSNRASALEAWEARQPEIDTLEESIPVWPDGERVSQLTFDILRQQLTDEMRAHENTERMLETEREMAKRSIGDA